MTKQLAFAIVWWRDYFHDRSRKSFVVKQLETVIVFNKLRNGIKGSFRYFARSGNSEICWGGFTYRFVFFMYALYCDNLLIVTLV